MPSFILRDLDPSFWARVQAKAKAEGVQVKALILKLLTTWLGVLAIVLVTTGCANGFAAPMPLQPTPEAENLGMPTSLTLGTMPGPGGKTVVTAHVQNLHGTPLGNMVVTFTTTVGAVSPDVVNTSADGSASTTLTASDTARVLVTVGPMHNSTLIAAPNVTPGQPPPPTTPTAGVFLNVQGAAQTGDLVSLSVSSSALGVTWHWDFGDGATDSTTTFSTTHVYGRAGIYLASVSGAGTASASAPITVTDKPVIVKPTPAAFAVAVNCPKSTTLVQACNVSASANGAPLPSNTITSVQWDFGDGQTALLFSPVTSNTYAHAGTYTIFATVTAAGQQATTSTTVTVPATP